jgi:hypothetical protein
VIGVNKSRSLDAVAALPTNREGSIGFFDVVGSLSPSVASLAASRSAVRIPGEVARESRLISLANSI